MSVAVIDADRRAAVTLAHAVGRADFADQRWDDDHPIIQAFAKHRSTSTEEVERLTKALRHIVTMDVGDPKDLRRSDLKRGYDGGVQACASIARTALGAASHVE